MQRVTGGSFRILAISLFCLGSLGTACQDSASSSWRKDLAEGTRAFEQGRYEEAEQQLKAALVQVEQSGPNDPRLPNILDGLAETYRAQGRYAEAEPLYKRSIAIRERTNGPERSSLVGTLNGLADLYRAQGRYAEAEPLYKRSLAYWERTAGREHSHVATLMEKFATVLRGMDRAAEAAELEARVRAIRAKGPQQDVPQKR